MLTQGLKPLEEDIQGLLKDAQGKLKAVATALTLGDECDSQGPTHLALSSKPNRTDLADLQVQLPASSSHQTTNSSAVKGTGKYDKYIFP